MATYQDAIDRLNQKLRAEEAWPSDSSKQYEQLYLLYNAGIAVLRGLPLVRLPGTVSPSLQLQATNGNLRLYTLPDDSFYYRPDAGIKELDLNGETYYPTQSLPKETLFALKKNIMHNDRILFGFDFAARKVHTLNVPEMSVTYFRQPALPTDPTAAYPLSDDNDYELAMSIVAAHVSGETIRDSGQSTFQTFLTQLYGEDINVE